MSEPTDHITILVSMDLASVVWQEGEKQRLPKGSTVVIDPMLPKGSDFRIHDPEHRIEEMIKGWQRYAEMMRNVGRAEGMRDARA